MAVHATLNVNSGAGFANPVVTSQSVFRSAMNAIARPGSIHTLSEATGTPSRVMPAIASLALTLFDHDTPIWLDEHFAADPAIGAWLRFQTSAPLTDDSLRAAFAVIATGASLPDFGDFARGTLEYPDRSTTLIVQVDTLHDGASLILRGPGISGHSTMRAGTLPSDFVARMQSNRAQFPLGVDLLLVCGAEVIALPRSTHVAAKEV